MGDSQLAARLANVNNKINNKSKLSPKTILGNTPKRELIKTNIAIMVRIGINIFNFLVLKMAKNIMGAISAVPVKLVRANNTNSSEAIKEKARTTRAKKTMATLVIPIIFVSFPDNNDLNSPPKAKIWESDVEMAAAIKPNIAKAATNLD